jgi:hypothetical protein
MQANLRGRVLAAALLAPVALGAVGCERDKAQSSKRAAATCGPEVSRTASTPLPSDLPAPSGATVYDYASQGKTRIWYVAVDGAAADLVRLRDQVKAELTARGYAIKGTDQEPGAEAEAEFEGPHSGTIQVRTLCSGKDVIRYKLES